MSSAKPKKFLNSASDAVSEMISGLLLQYPNSLRKLSNHNVLLSSSILSPSTFDPSRVAILSGGGSGHEPSHAGWIGEGMLTGAILGGIFASPSVSSILAAIRAVTRAVPPSSSKDGDGALGGDAVGGPAAGCLLIVKNYTGDRLNFALAATLANAEHRPTALVIIADDTALPPSTLGTDGARGIAGTVLLHKTVGAAAREGKSLAELVELAEGLAGRIGTLGVALDCVTVPGAKEVNGRLEGGDIMEVGLGIHGEAGVGVQKLVGCDELVEGMLGKIRRYGAEEEEGARTAIFKPGDDLAVMVNNLGGTSNFEMSIVANSVVKLLEGDKMRLNCSVSRLYVGSFMTAFDMHGISISILSLTDAGDPVRALLDADTTAPAWGKVDVWDTAGDAAERPSAVEIPEVTVAADADGASAHASITVDLHDFEGRARLAVQAACEALIEAEPMLTKYDTIVGDGDCGFTMERGAKEIIQRLSASDTPSIDASHPVPLFAQLADAVSSSMGGTSGILLELMFRKISTTLLLQTNIDGITMIEAFRAGVHAVERYGGATIGSRTMLDALLPALDAIQNGHSTNGMWQKAVDAASQGVESTARMTTAKAGRSNYLSGQVLDGTPDPGAYAVKLVFEAIHTILS